MCDVAELAKRFKTEGMKAYVELIQEKEKAIGCDVFTHQKWSGASYSDRVLNGTSQFPFLHLFARTDEEWSSRVQLYLRDLQLQQREEQTRPNTLSSFTPFLSS